MVALNIGELARRVGIQTSAIRYYEEIGTWSDEAQAHNDKLVARQEALAKAWEELKAEDPENWEEAWDAKRREALAAGGFEVVF